MRQFDTIRGTVYLLHFTKPIGNPTNTRGRAQHYIGWSSDHDMRLEAHLSGNGARIMRAVAQAGIAVKVARTWENRTRNFERRLKNCKRAKHYCPVCGGPEAAFREPRLRSKRDT